METKQVEEGKAKLKEFSIRSRVLYAGAPPAPDPESEVEPREEKTANRARAEPTGVRS